MRPLLPTLMTFALAGCVSVQLPSLDGTRASSVEFQAPASPFSQLKSDIADKAWMSSQTGNTISYLSDCGAKLDPSLDQLIDESAQSLDTPVVKSEALTFNHRAAKIASVDGVVDGIPMKLKLLVLKKNDCNYTLSYTAKPSAYDREVQAFETFTQSFKAP